MTSLCFLNEPEMIECMRQRFRGKDIYTNIGPILLAVNPFERLPIYTDSLLEKYFKADGPELKRLGPHVYQISARAYTRMLFDKFNPDRRENQSILVNGESGAGIHRRHLSFKLHLCYACVSSYISFYFICVFFLKAKPNP